MRPLFRIWVLAALALGACAPAVMGDDFRLSEFAISGPAQVGTGETSLSVTNSGELPHTLVVADESGVVVAATDLIEPGESMSLEIDLSPGSYQFTCRIVAETPDGRIVDHFESGMVQTVTVRD